MIDVYVEYLKSKRYSSNTIDVYCYLVQRFLRYADIKDFEETEVDYNTILRYITHLRKKNNDRSISLHLSALKHFFNCIELPYNPVKIKMERTSNLVINNTLSNQQLLQVYDRFPCTQSSVSIRNKVVLSLIVFQAIRTMEISNIKLSNIDLNDHTVTLDKSEKINARKLRLNQYQIHLLMQYINSARNLITKDSSNDFLVVTSKPKNNTKSILNQVGLNLRKLPSRPNFPLIRTSVIKNWLKQHDLRTVQYMCGHKYISSTEKYVSYDVKQLKDSIEKCHPLQ